MRKWPVKYMGSPTTCQMYDADHGVVIQFCHGDVLLVHVARRASER